MSRQFITSIFLIVEPACVVCRRKLKDCAVLKRDKYRYWLFAHGNFLG
jgi:hypothetical protein